MKFVILIILHAGVSFASHKLSPSSVNQLPGLGDLTNVLQQESGVLNSISGYINEIDDALVLTGGVKNVISALEALSANVSNVAMAISSDEALSGINESFKEWSEAESALTAAYLGALGGSSTGSVADLNGYASALIEASLTLSGLAGVINGLPSDAAVILGRAAEYYGFTNSGISQAESIMAETISAAAINSKYASVLNSLSSAFNQISVADSDVSAAFVNASQ